MMTLHELKNRVQVADVRAGVPGRRELLETGVAIVVKEVISDDVEISVFENGYVLFQDGKHYTVFRLHDCEGYDYCPLAGKNEIFQASFFENENWYMLLLMVGMDRLEKNQSCVLSNHKVCSIDVGGFISILEGSQQDVLERIIQEETMMEIRSLLSEKQMYAVTAYYCEGISQLEISKRLGISQQAASKMIKSSIMAIRNAFDIEDTDIRRHRNKK